MATTPAKTATRLASELIVLIPSSMLVGYSIGTIQHYVAFGVWGYGFGNEALQLASFEGGFVGALAAVPTSLVTYYAVLARRVDSKLGAYIVLGSLVGGCAFGALFFWPSAGLTPVLTIALAAWLRNDTNSNPE